MINLGGLIATQLLLRSPLGLFGDIPVNWCCTPFQILLLGSNRIWIGDLGPVMPSQIKITLECKL